MNSRVRMLLAVAGLVAVSGCVVVPARAGFVYVHRAPPVEREEVVAVAPVRGQVWIHGYWAWRHDDYVWVPGRWAAAPEGYHEWVDGRWDHDRNGWFFIEGHWR